MTHASKTVTFNSHGNARRTGRVVGELGRKLDPVVVYRYPSKMFSQLLRISQRGGRPQGREVNEKELLKLTITDPEAYEVLRRELRDAAGRERRYEKTSLEQASKAATLVGEPFDTWVTISVTWKADKTMKYRNSVRRTAELAARDTDEKFFIERKVEWFGYRSWPDELDVEAKAQPAVITAKARKHQDRAAKFSARLQELEGGAA